MSEEEEEEEGGGGRRREDDAVANARSNLDRLANRLEKDGHIIVFK